MLPRLLLSLLVLGSGILAPARDQLALLGTYTGNAAPDSRGIYAVKLNSETGALSTPELVAELPNPEFLALHPNGRVVYALTRMDTPGHKDGAAVAAFALEPGSGRLTLLNRQPADGASLTHLAVDATGRMLVAASYGGGYVVSFPLAADGRLGAHATWLNETGPLGPVRDRQNAPHPHSVTLSPDNRFAFIADLGVDRVFSYALDPVHGTVALNEAGGIRIEPGSGPRHTRFSPDGKSFYVLDELDGTITVCRFDDIQGVAEPFQRVSTSADDYHGRNSCSEIRVHPTGRFVYAANRGHNGIAVFARDQVTGILNRVEIMPTGGQNPRNFSLTPDGAWLLCGHQDSGQLTIFKVDATTGRLTATPHTAAVAKAVCVLFLP